RSRYDELHDKYHKILTTKAGTRYEQLAALVFKALQDKNAVIHDMELAGEDPEVKHQIDVTVEIAGNTSPLSGRLSRDSRIDRGMIQDGKLRGFAMGHAIPVRTDYTSGEVRRFAQRAKDAAQARRLLAIAAVLEGASRQEAAKIGGMDRQTLRD